MIGKYLVRGFGGMWSGLGFYRGTQSYYEDTPTAEVSIAKAIGYGFYGLFVYINPFAIPIILNVEYKRITNSP